MAAKRAAAKQRVDAAVGHADAKVAAQALRQCDHKSLLWQEERQIKDRDSGENLSEQLYPKTLSIAPHAACPTYM